MIDVDHTSWSENLTEWSASYLIRESLLQSAELFAWRLQKMKIWWCLSTTAAARDYRRTRRNMLHVRKFRVFDSHRFHDEACINDYTINSSCLMIDCLYAAEWFGLVWVSISENQTGVGLIPCRSDVISIRFDSGFYRFEPERIIYRMYIYIDCFYI